MRGKVRVGGGGGGGDGRMTDEQKGCGRELEY